MIALTDPKGWHHADRQAWKFVLLSVLERKYLTCPQPGIEPRSLDLQANTLPRRCKSWLLPQGSRSVLYT